MSKVYNELCVRVEEWGTQDDRFELKTSRTTYYDSLLTNRAMDFRWKNGMTIGEQYYYPPFPKRLEESSLSNHLGINGFVETIDGYIPLVKRRGNLAVAKNVYGCSVGAVLKTRMLLKDDRQKLRCNHIIEAMGKEVFEELGVNIEKCNESSKPHIVAAYCDIVEGGKPQLLFHVKINETKANMEEIFKKSNRWRLRDKKDGRKLAWIDKKKFTELCVFPDAIFYENKKYLTSPQTSASLVLLMEYLDVSNK